MSLILITGMPGVGKTTIVRNVGTELQRRSIPFDGFFTEELRSPNGERSGFDIVTFDGKRAPLARTRFLLISDFFSNIACTLNFKHISVRNAPAKNRVGKYTVCVAEFESVALPALAGRSANLLLLDEIGKMELKSRPFEDRLQQITDAVVARGGGGGLKFVATIPLKATLSVVERLKRAPGVQLFHVTVSNREKIGQDVLEAVMRMV